MAPNGTLWPRVTPGGLLCLVALNGSKRRLVTPACKALLAVIAVVLLLLLLFLLVLLWLPLVAHFVFLLWLLLFAFKAGSCCLR